MVAAVTVITEEQLVLGGGTQGKGVTPGAGATRGDAGDNVEGTRGPGDHGSLSVTPQKASAPPQGLGSFWGQRDHPGGTGVILGTLLLPWGGTCAILGLFLPFLG